MTVSKRQLKPTKDCKHARETIENKNTYSESEKDDGCWKCGGPLTIKPKNKIENLDLIDMDDDLRKKIESDPKELADTLKWMNQPEWQCKDCNKKFWEAIKKQRELGYPGAIPIEDIIAEFHNGVHDAKMKKLMQEVIECGPDCPWFDRLEMWEKDYGKINSSSPSS
jgi:hypothetical protein